MLPTRLESANRNYIKNRRCVVHRRCEEQILKIRYSKDDEHNTNKLDIDRTTVSKIELANAGVSLDVIFDIADLFEIPVEKLFVFR